MYNLLVMLAAFIILAALNVTVSYAFDMFGRRYDRYQIAKFRKQAERERDCLTVVKTRD